MKTSIVILTCNKLDYTRKCIESIRKYTEEGSYEIIVVDNGSTDDTVCWLNTQKDIKKVLNAENLGFPKGCNQGIELAEGDNLLLLNNDVVVTSSWLKNMQSCLYSSEDIGAVGPITNSCSNFQAIDVSYRDMDEMQIFARSHNISDPDMWEERLRLIGFCFLVKKKAADAIGPLDEIFTPGNFEDDDYCVRLRRAGYRLLLCKDTFIHHFGSMSFRDKGQEYFSLIEANKKKFESKWAVEAERLFGIRKDVAGLINASLTKKLNILHIGCEGGGTLLYLKNRFINSRLYGMERDGNYILNTDGFARFVAGSTEELISNYKRKYFDYIIITDQEMDTDMKLLRKVALLIKPSGCIISGLSCESKVCAAFAEVVRNEFKEITLEKYESYGQTIILMKGFNSMCDVENNPCSTENTANASHIHKTALDIEQNDVRFTGERLVINREVKERYANVLEEHTARYELACGYVEGRTVLDAACGAGYGTKMLIEAGASEAVGVDICSDSVKKAEADYGDDKTRFMTGNVTTLPFEPESFDVVVSFETIEHIKSGKHWINEAARVLRRNGLFIVSTPNRSITNWGTYFEEHPLNPYHEFEYTIAEFIGELLARFDVLELYGQTFIADNQLPSVLVMRNARKMDVGYIPETGIKACGHKLVALDGVKNAQPMYVVAVCRKKQ